MSNEQVRSWPPGHLVFELPPARSSSLHHQMILTSTPLLHLLSLDGDHPAAGRFALLTYPHLHTRLSLLHLMPQAGTPRVCPVLLWTRLLLPFVQLAPTFVGPASVLLLHLQFSLVTP